MKISKKTFTVAVRWLAVLALFLSKPDSIFDKVLLGIVIFGAIFETYDYLK